MNDENHEVELRALLDKSQEEELLSLIRKRGAILKSKKEIIDIYFCQKSAKSYDDIKMLDVGTYGLRIRKTIAEGKEYSELNIKIITRHANHHAWQEHETGIDNFSEAGKILEAIGFKPFITIEKTRTVYEVDGFTLNFEDIKDFGKAIEVEMFARHEEVPEAKEKLKKFLENLGISKEQILPQSINSIIMRGKSKF